MKTETVYFAMNAAESAMVADVLRDLGFDAQATENCGAEGMIPVKITYPVSVPGEQAKEACEALQAQGLAPSPPEE